MPRELLGQTRDLGGVIKTFRADGAFEMDEIEGTHGTRRRVFFDDVFLVSYHRERRPLFLVGTGLASLFFLGLGFQMLRSNSADRPAGFTMIAFGAPFILLFVLRLILQVDVITIFGRHGKARLEFQYRKAKAREVHQRICRDVRTAQATLRRNAPRPAPAAPIPEGDAG